MIGTIGRTVLVALLAAAVAACGSGSGGSSDSGDDSSPGGDSPGLLAEDRALDEVAELLAVEFSDRVVADMEARDGGAADSGVRYSAEALQSIARDALARSDYARLGVKLVQSEVSFEPDDAGSAAAAEAFSCTDAVDGDDGIALSVVPTNFSVADTARHDVVAVTVIGDDEIVYATQHEGIGGGYAAQRVTCPDDEITPLAVGAGDAEGAEYTVPDAWLLRATQTVDIYRVARSQAGDISADQLATDAGLARFQGLLDAAAEEVAGLPVVSVQADTPAERPACDEIDGRSFVSILDTSAAEHVLEFGIWDPADAAAPSYPIAPATFGDHGVGSDGWPGFGWSIEEPEPNAFAKESRACGAPADA